MWKSSIALLSLATSGTIATSSNIRRQAEQGLNTAAKAFGKLYFGSATDNNELTDSEYVAILSDSNEFGQITPGNSMKWDTIEPSRGTFNYANGDTIADLAEKNGQLLRCHTLVWYNQLPSWVTNGGFDNATLVEILQNHITEEVTHYKGKCYAWDVVNEAISDDSGAPLRDNIFLSTIGEAYIPIAFAAAAAADPDAKLYYNDYPSLEDQVTNMKAFTALGLEVAITELDIRAENPEAGQYNEQQSKDYAATIGACNEVKECVGVTIWDFTDKYSWVPGVFPGTGGALPWNENFKKKPAYDAILKAYSGASSSPAPISNGSSSVASSTAAATSVASSVSVNPSTGVPDKSTPASTPSVTVIEPVATGEAECAVEHVYV
ncbi:hypothetical protein Q7P35_003578 [Cladosporium inversicolor]